MLYLKSWLQEYIKQNLPEDRIIVDELNSKAFEVENIQKSDQETLFDIKVLPNRASDCLCHKEMAREISACLGFDFIDNNTHLLSKLHDNMDFYKKVFQKSNFKINILNPELCSRFVGVVVQGVVVKDSPEWLKQKLSMIGQKSINNIVDITNLVQFDINKPMHAYDYDNISGGDLYVRIASQSEILQTLDDKSLTLDQDTLIISDKTKALGLAGIKGGKYSGISDKTKTIFIESANFDSTLIRKTSQKYNLRTDASKRFESGISDNLVMEGICATLNLLMQVAKEQGFLETLTISEIQDNFPNNVDFETIKNNSITLSLDDINNTLGLSTLDKNILTMDNCINILKKLYINIVKSDDFNLTVTSPLNRMDLKIKEDIIEEIGRINGYNIIKSKLPILKNKTAKMNHYLLLENFLKDVFISHGFCLVFNYSFRSKGEIEVFKPLSEEKSFLRSELTSGIIECAQKNLNNMPLLDVEEIRIFEFGNVFLKNTEERRLAFVIADGKKKSDFSLQIDQIILDIKSVLKNKIGINIENFERDYIVLVNLPSNNIEKFAVEINIEKIIKNNIYVFKKLQLDKSLYYPEYKENLIKYNTFAVTPFVIRDIAFWSNIKLSNTDLDNIILDIKNKAGDDSLSVKLFDSFEKDFEGVKKYSYAYRIIYQNKSKTLTDQEVNIQSQNVYDYLQKSNFEIR